MIFICYIVGILWAFLAIVETIKNNLPYLQVQYVMIVYDACKQVIDLIINRFLNQQKKESRKRFWARWQLAD